MGYCPQSPVVSSLGGGGGTGRGRYDWVARVCCYYSRLKPKSPSDRSWSKRRERKKTKGKKRAAFRADAVGRWRPRLLVEAESPGGGRGASVCLSIGERGNEVSWSGE